MTVDSPARRWVLALAATLPLTIVTAGVLVFAALEAGGRTPSSDGPLRNVAEAAAMGQASEVIRMLREGQDPNRIYPARPEIISSTVTRVTALEAAIWSRRAQQVELLDRAGAIRDTESRRYLACLAADVEVDEVVEYLSPDGPPECASGEALKQVQARTPRS
jgi:hypothetical protein